MAKVLIGNFKGPKGNDGQKGNKGEKGETGQRGSRWSEGTAITGTSTTATIFSGSGITDALVNDVYLNTSTGNVYRCTVAGAAAAAKWVYVGCIKGAKGNDGKTPTVVDVMTVAFTQASSRANIATGEKMSTIMGKIKKFFADLTAPAFAQMITTKDDLLATKKTGYVPDAKAVADAVTDVNSKLDLLNVWEDITEKCNFSYIQPYSTKKIYKNSALRLIAAFVPVKGSVSNQQMICQIGTLDPNVELKVLISAVSSAGSGYIYSCNIGITDKSRLYSSHSGDATITEPRYSGLFMY